MADVAGCDGNRPWTNRLVLAFEVEAAALLHGTSLGVTLHKFNLKDFPI